jgi:hypothetical protein
MGRFRIINFAVVENRAAKDVSLESLTVQLLFSFEEAQPA